MFEVGEFQCDPCPARSSMTDMLLAECLQRLRAVPRWHVAWR